MILFPVMSLIPCYFRFDPDVIEQRKSCILEFLYYCAENPVIYRSQCFVKFFEDGNASPTEPYKNLTEADENDGMSSSIDYASSDLSSLNNSIELDEEQDLQKNNSAGNQQVIESDESSFDHLSTGFDYLYNAAMCFSQAVQEEANLRYKQAFELYKVGIDKLLTGAKSDNNERRKRIAKTKAGKYLERAELLYENHIAQLQEESFLFEDLAINDAPSILALERPVNNLSRFKVISISDFLMRVQDCTDKKFYVLKNVYKDPSFTISLPQSIPFMTKLISYYKTENSIFLLLPLISGGLLWDYINSYSNEAESKNSNLEEIFVEPPEVITEQIIIEAEPNIDNSDHIPSTFDVEIAEEMFPSDERLNDGFGGELVATPSFDTLSPEMDINDLMSCSQKLLQSVSKTLEKSQIQAKDKEKPIPIQESVEKPPTIADIQKQVEPQEAILKTPLKVSRLPEIVLKQWASELVVAVNSMHKAGIICGDLNLDNLMLGPLGHLTLTFFYQSDRNEYQQLSRLNPKAMKCLYIAFDFPLTKESDWYSVGVLIYEILTRDRFYLNHRSGISRFNEVQYSNPDDVSEEVKNLLHGLIIEKPDKRFKYDDLINHPYFHNVDWSEVEKCGNELSKI